VVLDKILLKLNRTIVVLKIFLISEDTLNFNPETHLPVDTYQKQRFATAVPLPAWICRSEFTHGRSLVDINSATHCSKAARVSFQELTKTFSSLHRDPENITELTWKTTRDLQITQTLKVICP